MSIECRDLRKKMAVLLIAAETSRLPDGMGSLSMLGFAAASDMFGASLYEPCGQIDQIGNLFGLTATNRRTSE